MHRLSKAKNLLDHQNCKENMQDDLGQILHILPCTCLCGGGRVLWAGEKFLTASHLSGAAAHRDSGWFVLKVPHGYLLDLKQVCLSRWPFQYSPSLNVSKNALALLSRMHPIKHVIHRGTESKVWDHKQWQRPQARASLGGQCLPVVPSHKDVHRPPGLKTRDSPVLHMKRQEAKYCGSWADYSHIRSTLRYLVLNILRYQSVNICWAPIGG